MLVVSICEAKRERNFACTGLTFEDEFVFIVSYGVTYRFRTVEIMEIVPVYNADARQSVGFSQPMTAKSISWGSTMDRRLLAVVVRLSTSPRLCEKRFGCRSDNERLAVHLKSSDF